MTEIKDILNERGVTHGLFEDNAKIALALRTMWRAAPGWDGLSMTQKLAMDEIALKQARILSGGSGGDSWTDIAGYAELGSKD